jgi:hypothetical protein
MRRIVRSKTPVFICHGAPVHWRRWSVAARCPTLCHPRTHEPGANPTSTCAQCALADLRYSAAELLRSLHTKAGGHAHLGCHAQLRVWLCGLRLVDCRPDRVQVLVLCQHRATGVWVRGNLTAPQTRASPTCTRHAAHCWHRVADDVPLARHGGCRTQLLRGSALARRAAQESIAARRPKNARAKRALQAREQELVEAERAAL